MLLAMYGVDVPCFIHHTIVCLPISAAARYTCASPVVSENRD